MSAGDPPRRFASVMLDVDSTLSTLEGIDWLAARRGPALAEEVEALTRQAMAGQALLDTVYEARLAKVAPSRDDMSALGAAYVAHLVPGAREAIAAWQDAGVRVVLVSGGLRAGIEPLAAHVGIAREDLHAADVRFSADGGYAGVDPRQPLATPLGKAQVLRTLGLPRPTLVVGDGATDLEARAAADAFCAFTGVVARPTVVARADFVAAEFSSVTTLVLGAGAPP